MSTTRNNTHTRRKAAVALACAVVLCVGAVLSALTSYDTATNKFKLAEGLDIRVVEAKWDSHPDADADGVPDHAEGILPTQTIEKDPAIENLTDVQAYVFAEVSVPVRHVVTANSDGTLNAAADTELFSFAANGGWTLKATVPGDGEVTYRYAYDSPLGRGTTPTLFDSVTYANVAGDSLSGSELVQLVVVNARGVQAAGFADVEAAYAELYGDPEATFVTDVTVNDPSIAAQETYEIVRLEPMSVASTSTAKIDSQVTFSDVELAEDASYAVIAEGGDVADPIVEFVADEDMRAQAEAGGVTIGKVAFAVYSADDNSLDFYKRDTVPAPGDAFEGKVATSVYTGIETETYGNAFVVPWKNSASMITNVSIIDEEIAPLSTAYLFYGFSKCTDVDLAKLDTSKVTDMTSMFQSCSKLANLDVSSFNTSQVTSMSDMFDGCSSLLSLDVSRFDTSQVMNMRDMFNACSSLTSIDLSSFNTSKATKMLGMFSGCRSLTTLDVSGFDTSQVSSMASMFYGCRSLSTLDVSSFDTSKVSDMGSMFGNCTSLNTVFIGSGWNTKKVSFSINMFLDCPQIIGGSGFKYDSAKTDATYATTDYYLTLKEATADASVFSISRMVKDAMMQALAA